MRHKLIIDGNAVYEIDDECMRCKKETCDSEAKEESMRRPKAESMPRKSGAVIKNVQALQEYMNKNT